MLGRFLIALLVVSVGSLPARSVLHSHICVTPKTLTSLKASIAVAWKKVDKEGIKKSILSWPKRLEACVREGGGRFEHML